MTDLEWAELELIKAERRARDVGSPASITDLIYAVRKHAAEILYSDLGSTCGCGCNCVLLIDPDADPK